jgi:hypothetical protein
MGYTEKTVLLRGLDFNSGRTSNRSAGGVAGTGSINPTNSEPTTQNNSVTKVFTEEFLNSYTAIFTVTKNGGVLPSIEQQILLFQNGQLLIDTQYSISGSSVTIDSSTHYDGANYVIFFIII